MFLLSEEDAPKIVSDVPGKKSSNLLEKSNKYVPEALYSLTPIFIAKGEGAVLTDVDGNKYVDLATGISSLNTGHRHPRVMKEIQKQLDKYMHVCWHTNRYAPYVDMAEKLAEIAPGDFHKKVFLANSGAEAVENAVKIAIWYTQRARLIAFEYAFHGRTRMAVGLTGSVNPYRKGLGRNSWNIYRVPTAYCYRCPFGDEEYPECGLKCLDYLEHNLGLHEDPDEIAAMILEPVQGEGGFIVPPTEFVQGLKRICDEYGFLFIDDEIQAGLGRTGKMFGMEHHDVVPDIITVAKSLGGGLPLSAVIMKDEIADSLHAGALGTTFGGNPVSCVAGLETIDIIEENLSHAQEMGELMRKRMDEWYEQFSFIGDVRGLGMMRAIEFVEDRETKEPSKEIRDNVIQTCHKKGAMVISAGSHKNVLRFLPALNIREELLTKGFNIVEESLEEVAKER